MQRPGKRPFLEGDPYCTASGFWHVLGAARGQDGRGKGDQVCGPCCPSENFVFHSVGGLLK